VVGGLWRDRADSYSYFRRAVRPNELFFVYTTADREALSAYFERSRVKGGGAYPEAP
jgi:hypothetical protein